LPTGTVSLAFADNINGVEPAFSWMCKRKKREADGSTTSEYAVEDHAWRLYRGSAATWTSCPRVRLGAGDVGRQPHS
jgi:ribonucleoside-diphosphate reductase alpha chain